MISFLVCFLSCVLPSPCWRPSLSISLAVVCFYWIIEKQVFLLSYCQIWTDLGKILHTPIVVQNGADLDRDRRVGGSRPNQNDCFFSVILVTHSTYIETTDRRQTVKVEVRTGAIVKKFWNFVLWAEPDPKQHFSPFWGYPSTILRTAYRKQFYGNQWYRWKVETLKVCLLIVWIVYDQ